MATYEYLMNAYNKKYSQEYNKVMNSYSRHINDYYNYVTPYKSPKINKELSNMFEEYFEKQNYSQGYGSSSIPEKRTLWNRTMDILNIGNYMSAGFARGMVDDNITPFEGMVQGLRAGNPFGDGHEKWEYDYGGVLTAMGWEKEENPDGKWYNPLTWNPKNVAHTVVGFAGDVLLDPSTYISGGLTAVVKGSGKASAKKSLKVADILGDTVKYSDEVVDIAKGLKMTDEIAEKIITNSKVYKSGLLDLDLVDEVSKLTTSYNKLIGLNDKVDDVVLSLANAPFGKKIFGHYADKSITLVDGEALKKFGDVTLAPGYAKLRDSILGGKIGQMFSPNHKLYKLSGTRPEEVYKALKEVELKAGNTKGRLKAKDLINVNSDILKDLTPAENKEVMEVLEDKTKWNKIQKSLRYAESDDAEKLRKKIEIDKKVLDDNLSKAKRNRKYNEGRVRDVFDDIEDKKKALDAMESQRIEAINGINLNKAQRENLLYDVQLEIKDATEELIEQTKTAVNIDDTIQKYVKYVETSKNGDVELGLRKQLVEVYSKDYIEAFSDSRSDVLEAVNNYMKIENPFDQFARTTSKNYRNQVKKKGFISFTKNKERNARELYEKLPDWQFIKNGEDGFSLYPPKDIVKSVDMSNLDDEVYNFMKTNFVNKDEVIQDLSKYIFGKEGMINRKTYDRDVKGLITMIQEGKSIHELADEVFRNKKLYNGATSEMYRFIAQQIGYDKWEDYYTKPIQEFLSIEASGKKLTKDQEIELAGLLKDNMNREYYKRLFKDVHTYEETVALTTELKNSEISRPLNEIFENIADRELKNGRPLDDLLHDKFNIDDYLSVQKDGELSRQFHKKVISDDNTLNTKNRSTVKEILFNKIKNNEFEEATGMKRINKIAEEANNYREASTKIIESNNKKIEHIEKQINTLNKQIGTDVKFNEARIKKIQELTGEMGLLKKNNTGLKNHKYNTKVLKGKDFDEKQLGDGFHRLGDEVIEIMEDTLRKRKKSYGQHSEQEIFELVNESYESLLKQSRIDSSKAVQIEHEKIQKQISEINAKKRIAQARAKENYAKTVNRNDVIKYMDNGEVVEGIVNKVDKVDDTVKFTVEGKDGKLREISSSTFQDKVGKVGARSLDDIRDMSQLYDEFVVRQTELYQKVDELASMPKNFSSITEVKTVVDDVELNTINQVNEINIIGTNELYDKEIRKINDTIEKYEVKLQKNIDNVKKYSIDETTYIKEIEEMENAINNVDAFEAYARMKHGVDVDSYINKLPARMILDPDLDISPNSRKAVITLREEFLKMGKGELGLGHLTDEQFEAMAYEYLPHIVTPEGKDMFTRNKVVKKYIEGFGKDFGYGREFDPYSKSRKLKNLLIDGEIVENPTVEQLNKFFSKELKGNKAFQDNVAEIYLARALKHNDLMYDNKYMENMLELFGEDLDVDLGENFSKVMNYGMLKQYTNNIVHRNLSLDISDAISARLESDNVVRRFTNEIQVKLRNEGVLNRVEFNQRLKVELNDRIGKYIDTFMKEEMTDVVRKEMYTNRLKGFVENTGTSGMLDDLALPLTEMNDKNIQGLGDTFQTLQCRYEEHIKNKFGSLVGLKKNQGSKLNIGINDIENKLNNMLKSADDIDAERIERVLDRIKEYKELVPPQIKQMNTDIIGKSNMTRQIQIQRDNNNLINLYDKFTHFIKLNQTTVLPTFHLRNMYSNKFNNWLAIGNDAVDNKFRKQTLNVMKNSIDANDVLEITNSNGSITKIKWNDVLRKAEEYGVLDEGMFAKELGSTAGSSGILGKFLPKHLDPTDTVNFIPYKIGQEIGSKIEGHDRFIHFASQIKNGMSFEDAAKSVDEFLFDYSDLTMFEASVMKRVMPYYTWLRKNSALQLTQLLEQPDKYRMVSKVIGGIESMVDEEDRMQSRFVSDFAQDWIQLPIQITNERGVKENVILNPNLPFMDLNRIPDPSNIKGSLSELFTQTNPLIKLPIELAMNKNFFFNNEIAKEGESRLGKSVGHVANQLGAVPQIAGFFNKSGADLGLHTLKNATGITALSYDYNAHRAMVIEDAVKNGYKNRPNIVGGVAKSIMNGFANAISYADYKIEQGADAVANQLYEDRPLRPDERVDALRPISKDKYDKLSDEDKLKYVPPTKEEGMYYNQKAVELEKQVLAETGIGKSFVWTLVENIGIGDRNKPYQLGAVTKVKDGDTFDVKIGDRTETVRLLLVDSPEVSYDENIPSMPYADEAKQFSKSALINKDVKIYFDGNERDTYNRLLAYVEVDGIDFNKQLLQEGMATNAYAIDPPYQRQDEYRQAEIQSSNSGKGLWSLKGYAKPDSEVPFQSDYNINYDANDSHDWKGKKKDELNKKINSINRRLGR